LRSRNAAAIAVSLIGSCLGVSAPAFGSPSLAPPLVLPGDAAAARAPSAAGWLVGARPDARSAALARRFGARPVLSRRSVYLVGRAQARAFGRALRARGLLSFAEPNWRARRSGFPQDPLFGQQTPLQRVVNPALTPPAVTPSSPLLAIADAQIDASHPEFSGTQLSLANPAAPVTELHGTAVASIAAAAANGVGMVGVWPGMRIRGVMNDLTCAGDAAAIADADRAGAAVINMSYGGPFCFTEYLATSYAFGDGAILVAAGGNDFMNGNRITFPASDPHVLTVAATDDADNPAFFSSENAGIDMSAPGTGVLAAVSPSLDGDGTQDGYQFLNGTSFSTPMAAAAAAWLEAARPGFANDQYMDMLRFSTDDLGPPGWDQAFGFGRLNLQRALSASTGPHDPGEPNDDMLWVNGRAYRRADRPIFGRRSRVGRAAGFIDQWEDPADVFRVLLPAHSSVRFLLKPLGGDPDLYLWSSRARTIYSRRGLVRRSIRRGRREESLLVDNPGRASRVGFVSVQIDPSVRVLNAAYRLTVRRVH
jgi:hypothetical protein